MTLWIIIMHTLLQPLWVHVKGHLFDGTLTTWSADRNKNVKYKNQCTQNNKLSICSVVPRNLMWMHILWKVGCFRKPIGGFQNYFCEMASRSVATITTHEPNEAHSFKDCISFLKHLSLVFLQVHFLINQHCFFKVEG